MAWVFLFAALCSRISGNPSLKEKFSVHRVLPLFGLAGGLFLLVLGLVYLSRGSTAADYTEMYQEYSSLLVKAGVSLLLFAGIVAWFRIFRRNKV
jgi:hypothetical protein